MSDTKLTYWLFWTIAGENAQCLFDSRIVPVPYDQIKMNDPQYLYEYVSDYPDIALTNEHTCARIARGCRSFETKPEMRCS
jgi:hypothetical protein